MRIELADGGDALLRIGLRDWLFAIVTAATCFWGHAKLQCAKIDDVAVTMATVSARLDATEQSINYVLTEQRDIKTDHKETTRELREGLHELNAYLRERRLTQ